MTATGIVRLSTWAGVGAFLVFGLLPSIVFGAYIGVVVSRFVLHLADPGTPAARAVLVACAGVSVLLTGVTFVLCARGIGRSIARRRARRSADHTAMSRRPDLHPPVA